jgi:mycoredoxin
LIYTTPWCGDCARTKAYLRKRELHFRTIDVEDDPAAMATALRLNGGYPSVPTLVFPDGSTMTESTNRLLATKLGIAA